ncbi:MAG: zinc ribbon domain-containing protein [Candidatus Omnitrophica bacterium]|nr:zinc ribbon domain-containing protein [Candidatus Omnitrophota bacterium]
MKKAILVGLVLWTLGCASATPTQKGAVAGSAIGAGLGAIIGHQSGDTAKGALIGAAAGGLGGALVGDAMATQFCPTCGRDYTGGQTHCPLDGTALRRKGAPAQTAEQQAVQEELPKFCPACGRTYPAGASYCEADGTALKSKQK